MIDTPLDMMLLGQLLSTVQLVKMHLAMGEAERATCLWTELYRSAIQLFSATESLLAHGDVLRKQMGVWDGVQPPGLGRGRATLDLLIRQGYASYADMVAGHLVERAETFKRRLEELLSRPSFSSGLSVEHREVLRGAPRGEAAAGGAEGCAGAGVLRPAPCAPGGRGGSRPVSAFGTGRPSSGQPPLV